MYPMADMLNHEFGSTDVAILDGGAGQRYFTLTSGATVKEGRQVKPPAQQMTAKSSPHSLAGFHDVKEGRQPTKLPALRMTQNSPPALCRSQCQMWLLGIHSWHCRLTRIPCS